MYPYRSPVEQTKVNTVQEVHPVSITHQPIVVKGETEVSLNLGSLNTTRKT